MCVCVCVSVCFQDIRGSAEHAYSLFGGTTDECRGASILPGEAAHDDDSSTSHNHDDYVTSYIIMTVCEAAHDVDSITSCKLAYIHTYIHTSCIMMTVLHHANLHTYIHTYIHTSRITMTVLHHANLHTYIHTYIHTSRITMTVLHHANLHTYIHTYMHAYIHTS